MTLATSSTAVASRSWGEFLPPPARVQLLIVTALFAVVFGHTVHKQLAYTWTHDGNWSHGWIIPLISLFFIWSREWELFHVAIRPSYVGALVLAASLAVYLATYYYTFAYIRSVSMIAALFGVALLFGGWHVLRIVWFPIAYLLLAVPLPELLYVRLTFPLRRLASHLAGMLLGLLPDIDIESQNVVIDFYNRASGSYGHLNVAEACSGMRLIMAFAAIGLAISYLRAAPAWQRVGVVLSCIPIAIFCNMVRVAITGLLYVYGREDLARGTPHQLLGIGMLFLALGLFFLVSYVLGHLFVEDNEPREER